MNNFDQTGRSRNILAKKMLIIEKMMKKIEDFENLIENGRLSKF